MPKGEQKIEPYFKDDFYNNVITLSEGFLLRWKACGFNWTNSYGNTLSSGGIGISLKTARSYNEKEDTMYKRSMLGYEEAKGAVEAMIEENKKGDYWPYGCFAVVDYNGVLLYFARMDGSGTQGVSMAIRKAYTSAIWGRSTTAFGKMIDAKKFRKDATNYGPDYTTIPGGVAIIEPAGKDSRYATPFCIGAIGVATTGPGEFDEAIAMVGLKYIENLLWPEKAHILPLVETVYDKVKET